jgi:tetraacyldisaccharide 4'-kinase
MNAALRFYSLISRTVTSIKNVLHGWGWIKPRRAPLPVISVGNITLGGTGKTPLAIELLDHLLRAGFRPALVTRGYRGLWEKRGGVLSDGRALLAGWREGGDEPFLAAKRLPRAGVFCGRRRIVSCRRAAAMGFDAAVLDDGFQHRALRRDLDIVLHDPESRGARREPLSALKRADIILHPRSASEDAVGLLRREAPGALIRAFSVVPRSCLKVSGAAPDGEESVPLERLRGARGLAFCGLAGPGRFFATVERLGLVLAETIVFPDHHDYPERSWMRIRERCSRLRPDVVLTTEKDAVKLAGRPGVPGDVPLFALRIGLELDADVLDAVAAAPRRAPGGGT